MCDDLLLQIQDILLLFYLIVSNSFRNIFHLFEIVVRSNGFSCHFFFLVHFVVDFLCRYCRQRNATFNFIISPYRRMTPFGVKLNIVICYGCYLPRVYIWQHTSSSCIYIIHKKKKKKLLIILNKNIGTWNL